MLSHSVALHYLYDPSPSALFFPDRLAKFKEHQGRTSLEANVIAVRIGRPLFFVLSHFLSSVSFLCPGFALLSSTLVLGARISTEES